MLETLIWCEWSYICSLTCVPLLSNCLIKLPASQELYQICFWLWTSGWKCFNWRNFHLRDMSVGQGGTWCLTTVKPLTTRVSVTVTRRSPQTESQHLAGGRDYSYTVDCHLGASACTIPSTLLQMIPGIYNFSVSKDRVTWVCQDLWPSFRQLHGGGLKIKESSILSPRFSQPATMKNTNLEETGLTSGLSFVKTSSSLWSEPNCSSPLSLLTHYSSKTIDYRQYWMRNGVHVALSQTYGQNEIHWFV